MAHDVHCYKDLDGWQKAMLLVERTYRLIEGFPRSERLSVALGSQAEVETQIELAKRLGFVAASRATGVEEVLKEVGRLLYGLVRALERRLERGQ